MKYLSAYFWRRETGTSLILQQVTRQKGGLPLAFACICSGKEGNGPSVEERPAEQLTEWFHRRALPACERKGAEACVDEAQRLFLRKLESRSEIWREGMFAAFFGMGKECFYAWRGEAELKLVNLAFNRLHVRTLSRWTEELRCERAVLEPGVGVLLGSGELFDHLPAATLKGCLDVREMESQAQVQRHLSEAAQEAGRLGARANAAVLVVTR